MPKKQLFSGWNKAMNENNSRSGVVEKARVARLGLKPNAIASRPAEAGRKTSPACFSRLVFPSLRLKPQAVPIRLIPIQAVPFHALPPIQRLLAPVARLGLKPKAIASRPAEAGRKTIPACFSRLVFLNLRFQPQAVLPFVNP